MFLSCVSANRKRRCSADEHSADSSNGLSNSFNSSNGSSGSHKKPRVFFSEEQKDMLRGSYNKDPYPSQGRIEELASTLHVGTKTIVNWFHNHRMRAKQVQGLASPSMVPYPSHGSQFGGRSGGVGEQWEIGSNMSDHSSSASDTGSAQHLKGNYRAMSPDNAQWMFPRFEPMSSASGRHSSDIKPALDGASRRASGEFVGDNGNEAEDLSVTKSRVGDSTRDVRASAQDYSTGSPALDMEGHSSSNGGVNVQSDVTSHVPITTTTRAIDNTGSQSKSSRRKKSRPQWVFEGTQLERSCANGAVSPQSTGEGERGDRGERGEEKESTGTAAEDLTGSQQVKNNNCGETSDGDQNSGGSGGESEQQGSSSSSKKRKVECI